MIGAANDVPPARDQVFGGPLHDPPPPVLQ
jgi:hypothetical protein